VVSNLDHVTIVVTDLDEARCFFGLLGFEESASVVISGERMAAYMGVPGIEADHVTLVIPDAAPRQEIQLLRYRNPEVVVDVGSGDLHRTGFNHVCLRVTDLDAVVERLVAAGVAPRNQALNFSRAQAGVPRRSRSRRRRARAVDLAPQPAIVVA
jgi:catechol 2,3-dioxygenase-like lactoylglutathione lyase family enzyme